MSWRSTSITTALSLAALLGCRTPGPPPHFVRSSLGIVRAHEDDLARSFLELCRQAAPAVRSAVPGLLDRPIDLWVLPELSDSAAHGLTWPDRIELTSSMPAEGQLFILSHELVHYLVDDVWSRLPHVLEEGLCDWVAMRTDPERAVQRRAEHGILLATAAAGGLRLPAENDDSVRAWHFRSDIDPNHMPPLARILEFDDDELVDLQDTRESALIYAVGYLYVHRIGPDALRELCRIARTLGHDEVPLHWLHDAADLHPGEDREWALAAEALIGPAERTFILGTALEHTNRPAGRNLE